MRYLRYPLIFVLIAFALWRVLPHLKDFQDFTALAQNINWFYISLALATQITQYIGDGWLSHIVLKIIGVRINLTKTIQIASINVFAAHILPVGEAGVIATSYYFYKKLGVNNQGLIFLTLAWSITTGISLTLMLAASILFLPQIPHFPIQISKVFAYVLLAALAFTLLLFISRNSIWPKIEKFLTSFKLTRELVKFKDNLNTYKQDILRNKFLTLQAVLAGFIYYAGNVLTLCLCFLAFGKMPPIALITFAYFISLLAGWVTLAPAGLGATEATMIIIFHEFGISPTLSLAAMLSFRLISFWLPIPAGAISYFHLKSEKTS